MALRLGAHHKFKIGLGIAPIEGAGKIATCTLYLDGGGHGPGQKKDQEQTPGTPVGPEPLSMERGRRTAISAVWHPKLGFLMLSASQKTSLQFSVRALENRKKGGAGKKQLTEK